MFSFCVCVVLSSSMLQLNEWVVCKLSYKERARYTNTKSKEDKNSIIPVAAGLEDEPAGEAGESVQGEEEDMQPKMVPAAAHQASDYSEQDLCVEDYHVCECDVAFAQQNDAANCTVTQHRQA